MTNPGQRQREAPKRFIEEKQVPSDSMPDARPGVAIPGKAKVRCDAHVQYAHNFYSVELRLALLTLWIKASSAMGRVHRDYEAGTFLVCATGAGA